MTLELIYLPKYGDVLELNILKSIFELEQRIMQRTGYDQHCKIDYSAEDVAVQDSGDVEGTKRINAEGRPCAVHSTIVWACDPSKGHSCDQLLSDPVGLLNCPKANAVCSPDEFLFDNAFKVNKATMYSESRPNQDTADGLQSWNFLRLVDSAFAPGNVVAAAVRTEFWFGVPLAGYPTVNDDPDSQSEDLTDFLYDTYSDWLLENQLTNPEVEYVFNGHGLFSRYLDDVLAGDAVFAVMSMIFVLIYIAFMTNSWWLSFMGIGQIIMSFGPAYFIYYLVFQQRFFGVFNMLSIFIILGIGADDIFVFLDTWDSSQFKFKAPWKRMAYTWRHAGKAMLMTSLTTMISFISNANSSFPAIQTFGLFAAMLVLVNYCAVMIYFPSVVFIYNSYFEEWKFCFGGPAKLSELFHKGMKLAEMQIAKDDLVPKEDPDAEEQAYLVKEPSEGAVNHWFRHSYGNCVISAKVFTLFAFAALIGAMASQAARLESDPEPVKILPSENNYQKFMDKKPDYFARGGSVDAIEIVFAWGFNIYDPIDRSGTISTDVDDRGVPRYDPNFNLAKASRCIYSICEAAQEKSDFLKTGGYPDFPIDCFLFDFKKWVDANHGPTTWDEITGINADAVKYEDLLTSWGNDPDVLSEWKPFIYAEEVGTPPVADLRFVIAELKLTVTETIDNDEGEELWNRWEAFMQEQYTKSPCLEVEEFAKGFQSSFDFIFVRKILVEEAFEGIMLSLVLAFVILVLATTNVLVALYAAITILCIVVCTVGTIVLLGWKLGVLESIGLVMVPGLSVDFVAHLAEGYVESHQTERIGRVRDMLGRVAISVVSGAISTLGASIFLFLPTIIFFNKFGIMMFMTIGFSLFWALVFFPAILASPLGPNGNIGNWWYFTKQHIKCLRPKEDEKDKNEVEPKDAEKEDCGPDQDVEMEVKKPKETA
eukprot:TRINITY_DN13434_c0_g1_i1.p1 TRINITY_DN13434_c0_g1~~TRINITY_DN13434_c0_g1_i1.p1  ORF type:complete len:934 (+),score=153.99 TRINITY_DN13434_c0_g1_i1:447-3248(+)